MPIIKVGDKRIKFPDTMSQEEIGAALAQHFPQEAAPAEAPQLDFSGVSAAGRHPACLNSLGSRTRYAGSMPDLRRHGLHRKNDGPACCGARAATHPCRTEREKTPGAGRSTAARVPGRSAG